MTRPNRVQAHEHLCYFHGWYECGKVSESCNLKLKSVAECRTCQKVKELEERRRVVRSRRFWAPLCQGSDG